MPRSGPTTLALPSFTGATRRLILWNIAAFFLVSIFARVAPDGERWLVHLLLNPSMLFHGQVWQLLTYSLMPMGLLSEVFALLTLWFTGSMLEDARGSRWLYELYFSSVVCGGLLASALAMTGLLGMTPDRVFAVGPRAGIYGLLVAIAVLFGETEFLLFFAIRIRAKYLVAVYILFQLATLATERNAFTALVLLSGALCGYLVCRVVPRRGLASGLTERYYGLRNQFYRSKRRRAAKKFEVYMRGQNREVHFDKNGRYVDPDSEPGRDPGDKRWMN